MKTERIALDDLPNGYRVSTVLIVDDTEYCETMAFNPLNDGVQCVRTPSWSQALLNHAAFITQYKKLEG